MVLAVRRLTNNASSVPLQFSEMHRQRNSRQARRGRRSATFANGDIVLDLKGERNDALPFGTKDIPISFQNQMILEAAANLRVSACGGDREFVRAPGAYFQK